MDPLSGQTASIESEAYWRDPFRPVVTAARTRLSRYVILGKDPVFLERNVSKRGVSKKQRSKLALITAARESDLGANDSQIEERSHLGYLMKSGDVCLGYDLKDCQLVEDEAEDMRTSGKFPDVVFVRKLYGGVATGEADAAKKRIFTLQRLDVKKGEEDKQRGKKGKKDAEMENMDEEDFLQELEADREMRTRVNIYKAERAKTQDVVDNDDQDGDVEDDQKITLDELLDNLNLEIKEDAMDSGGNEETATQDLMYYVGEGERAAKDNLTFVGRDEAALVQTKDTAVPVNTWSDEIDINDL